ncbi:MAG TPA: PKD domain-containing protein [Opitutaceae bacterium]|nr:PKD domain-containing protein [Opitutaceae bacterium]
MNKKPLLSCLIVLLALATPGRVAAFDRPNTTFKVFQFPRDRIPRIDGDTSDWDIVPDSYAIHMDQFVDDTKKHAAPDPKTLDVKVRVGWVKGLNRLYFLYEADDNYWDFAQPGLHNDTFELVVDGDASGGPLIDKGHKEFWTPEHVGAAAARPDDRISVDDAHWAIHGVQAQNYHIFTPAAGKDWCMAWSSASWIREFPWANSACRYHFKPGEPGHLVLEFWITPFDYAGPEGPQRAVESMLRENKLIGLGMIVIDYDDVNARHNDGFWNLSRHHTAYGDASELCAFRLMPFEPRFLPPLEARWSFQVVDMDRRLVAFKDESVGDIKSWQWDFGDGATSTERNPLHTYRKPGNYVTVLQVTGADGTTSRWSKVWAVQLR